MINLKLGYWDMVPLKLGYWDMGPLKLGYLGYRDPPPYTALEMVHACFDRIYSPANALLLEKKWAINIFAMTSNLKRLGYRVTRATMSMSSHQTPFLNTCFMISLGLFYDRSWSNLKNKKKIIKKY